MFLFSKFFERQQKLKKLEMQKKQKLQILNPNSQQNRLGSPEESPSQANRGLPNQLPLVEQTFKLQCYLNKIENDQWISQPRLI